VVIFYIENACKLLDFYVANEVWIRTELSKYIALWTVSQ